MLKDKIVVITGGAGLLGEKFCEVIAGQGGIAVVADNNLKGAAHVATAITSKYPEQAIPMGIDITSKSSVTQLIDDLVARYGRIDAVINNAYPRNSNYGRNVEDVSYEDFCENLSLHLGGYFLIAQQFALFFSKNGHGNIINLSSIYGVIAPKFEIYSNTTMTMPVEYAAIKSAIIQLTRYFAQYYKAKGIRVNCISPGGILDRQPEDFIRSYNSYCGIKGMLDPKDICGSLLFLLSDSSQFITGQNLVIDDGFSL